MNHKERYILILANKVVRTRRMTLEQACEMAAAWPRRSMASGAATGAQHIVTNQSRQRSLTLTSGRIIEMKRTHIDHLRDQLAEIDQLPIAEAANLRLLVQAEIDEAVQAAIGDSGPSATTCALAIIDQAIHDVTADSYTCPQPSGLWARCAAAHMALIDAQNYVRDHPWEPIVPALPTAAEAMNSALDALGMPHIDEPEDLGCMQCGRTYPMDSDELVFCGECAEQDEDTILCADCIVKHCSEQHAPAADPRDAIIERLANSIADAITMLSAPPDTLERDKRTLWPVLIQEARSALAAAAAYRKVGGR